MGVNKTSLTSASSPRVSPIGGPGSDCELMSGRQVSIGFDDYQTEVAPLDNAGPAYPLSPILCSSIRPGRPAGLIFTVWHLPSSMTTSLASWLAKENLAKIQPKTYPIEAWPGGWVLLRRREDRTHSHYCKRKEQSQGQLVMNGNTIKPSTLPTS